MDSITSRYLSHTDITAKEVRDALRAHLIQMVANGEASLSLLGHQCSVLYTEAVRCITASCVRSIAPSLANSTCMLVSGSIATHTATPSSDIDLVLLTTIENSSQAVSLRHLLIAHLDECGFPNTDCAIVGVSANRCAPPIDLIDRQIAEGACYVTGNPLLYRYYLQHMPCISQTTLELLLRHVTSRQADLQWQSDSTSKWKHASGGRRDLMRLEHFLGRLRLIPETTNEAQTILHQACHYRGTVENWDACQSWKSIWPSFVPVEQLPSLENLAFATSEIQKLYVQAERLVVSVLPTVIRSLFTGLAARRDAGIPITMKELLAMNSVPSSRVLTPYALSMLESIDEAALRLADSCGWLGLMALTANPRTPDEVLRHIATIPGYDWRNVRDQVSKHPNVQHATLAILAQSDLRFTRIRALEAMARRNWTAP